MPPTYKRQPFDDFNTKSIEFKKHEQPKLSGVFRFRELRTLTPTPFILIATRVFICMCVSAVFMSKQH